MEEKRFDDLARLIGRGASRRSILKGLLGLGGAATSGALATVSSADARTLRTRSTVTTAPPPDCEPGHQFCGGQGLEYCCPPGQCFDGLCCPEGTERCGDECVPAGQCTSSGDQCATGNPCGTACCPADASCARSGNTDICCGGSAGGVPCGLDCCSEPLQCCDGECCAGGMVCLGQVYGGYEEVCCPTEQTCDGQCCQGTCYTPLGTSLSGFERACCPAEANLCYGTDAFAGVAVCCQGETPDCCANPDGSPVCLTVEQCCTAEECGHLTDPSTCQIGDCSGFACHAQQICDENEECCAGGANTCCPTSQSCCGPICCDAGLSCCERDVEGTLTFICYDASLDGACCDDSECPGNPATCDEGACLDNQTCSYRTTCGPGERCCEGDAQTAGFCRNEDLCCFDSDCDDAPANCSVGVCDVDGCRQVTTCEAGGQCCVGTAEEPGVCAPAENGCCESSECDDSLICHNYSCACPAPYVMNASGSCVQCDSEQEYGWENCWRFGLHLDCARCVDDVCAAGDRTGNDCELGESGDQGFCLGETGFCVPCLQNGVSCTDSVQCCGPNECLGDVCGGTVTTPDPDCEGVTCGPNQICEGGECECSYPYVMNGAGDCVQCDSNDEDGEDNCQRFGLSSFCVDCIDNVCSPADDLGDTCELDGSFDEGFCLGETGICVPCLYWGVVCTDSNQCCGWDVECLEGFCGGPPECSSSDDCGECEDCTEEGQCTSMCASCHTCIEGECIDDCAGENECTFCSWSSDSCQPRSDNADCSAGVCCDGSCTEGEFCPECVGDGDCPGSGLGCIRCRDRLCVQAHDVCFDIPCRPGFCSVTGNCLPGPCDCSVDAPDFDTCCNRYDDQAVNCSQCADVCP